VGPSSANINLTKSLYDDDDEPVWPTWVVGALFRDARRTHLKTKCCEEGAHSPSCPNGLIIIIIIIVIIIIRPTRVYVGLI
jgi:hypothetical protein